MRYIVIDHENNIHFEGQKVGKLEDSGVYTERFKHILDKFDDELNSVGSVFAKLECLEEYEDLADKAKKAADQMSVTLDNFLDDLIAVVNNSETLFKDKDEANNLLDIIESYRNNISNQW